VTRLSSAGVKLCRAGARPWARVGYAVLGRINLGAALSFGLVDALRSSTTNATLCSRSWPMGISISLLDKLTSKPITRLWIRGVLPNAIAPEARSFVGCASISREAEPRPSRADERLLSLSTDRRETRSFWPAQSVAHPARHTSTTSITYEVGLSRYKLARSASMRVTIDAQPRGLPLDRLPPSWSLEVPIALTTGCKSSSKKGILRRSQARPNVVLPVAVARYRDAH